MKLKKSGVSKMAQQALAKGVLRIKSTNMEKKKYQKPSMKVYQLQQPTRMLVGSPDQGGSSYIPSMNIREDDKRMA